MSGLLCSAEAPATHTYLGEPSLLVQVPLVGSVIGRLPERNVFSTGTFLRVSVLGVSVQFLHSQLLVKVVFPIQVVAAHVAHLAQGNSPGELKSRDETRGE